MDIYKLFSRRKLGIMALFLLAPLLIYLISQSQNDHFRPLVLGVGEILFSLIAIIGLWMAAKQYRQISKKYHVAWLFLLIAVLSTLVADLFWRFSSNPRMPDFFISAADSVYIFEYFCFFVAMGIFGVQHFKRIEWLKRAFDVSIIIIATLLAFLIFVFKPAINILDSQNNTGNFLLLLYPLADIILMFAALGVIYFKPKKVYLIPFWWILASFGVIGVTDYFFSLQMIKEVYSAGGMVNIGWWYSNLLLGLAGIIQYRFLITKENKDVILKKTTVFRKWLTSWVVYFPYILVGGVYLLFIIYHNSALNLLRELFTGLGAIFGLVLVRQVVVISENRQLLKSLSLSNQKLKLQTQDLQGEIDNGLVL
ncbi:MAG: hypothetical protein CVU45_00315 [Chloroflexi bacterium HGW-Chloroflexi-7]|nr:MAG: hypothetical protein CVU45_00315 [Chloroflexi bacterium HGW-Chloroflexi-7]